MPIQSAVTDFFPSDNPNLLCQQKKILYLDMQPQKKEAGST